MFHEELFCVLFEVFLGLSLDKFGITEDVLLDFKKLLKKLLEGPSINISEFSNQNGIQDAQVP
jgi:hypothetical protein